MHPIFFVGFIRFEVRTVEQVVSYHASFRSSEGWESATHPSTSLPLEFLPRVDDLCAKIRLVRRMCEACTHI